MAPRPSTDLHDVLKNLMPGIPIYFQPPESIRMQYPCLIYTIDGTNSVHADNIKYADTRIYQLILVQRQPDTYLLDVVNSLQMCEHTGRLVVGGLYQDQFRLFF